MRHFPGHSVRCEPANRRDAGPLRHRRAQGRVRGPLHGSPIALKDNIHTTNMPTTGGALAFDGMVPPYEATPALLVPVKLSVYRPAPSETPLPGSAHTSTGSPSSARTTASRAP